MWGRGIVWPCDDVHSNHSCYGNYPSNGHYPPNSSLRCTSTTALMYGVEQKLIYLVFWGSWIDWWRENAHSNHPCCGNYPSNGHFQHNSCFWCTLTTCLMNGVEQKLSYLGFSRSGIDWWRENVHSNHRCYGNRPSNHHFQHNFVVFTVHYQHVLKSL